MKIETLAKRIAKKTGEPILEKVVLGQATAHDLPDHCIPWHGATTGKDGLRIRVRRDYGNQGYPGFEYDRLRPVIQYQKKRHYVPRLLFENLTGTTYPYRLNQACGRGLCVNPLHFTPKEIQTRGDEDFGDVEEVPDIPEFTEEWSLADVEEVVEIALTENTPRDWSELMTLTIMEGAPQHMVCEYLGQINKPHLLPAH